MPYVPCPNNGYDHSRCMRCGGWVFKETPGLCRACWRAASAERRIAKQTKLGRILDQHVTGVQSAVSEMLRQYAAKEALDDALRFEVHDWRAERESAKADVAQRIERRAPNPKVAGSNPAARAKSTVVDGHSRAFSPLSKDQRQRLDAEINGRPRFGEIDHLANFKPLKAPRSPFADTTRKRRPIVPRLLRGHLFM